MAFAIRLSLAKTNNSLGLLHPVPEIVVCAVAEAADAVCPSYYLWNGCFNTEDPSLVHLARERIYVGGVRFASVQGLSPSVAPAGTFGLGIFNALADVVADVPSHFHQEIAHGD